MWVWQTSLVAKISCGEWIKPLRLSFFESSGIKRLAIHDLSLLAASLVVPFQVTETVNFLLPALTIAQLYRARWKVELFFRWIKQHLRIKAFYGTSENAVKTQAWVALSIYVLVAIVKKQLGLDLSLYKILQILSVTVFEKTPILEGFSNFNDGFTDAETCNQLNLFDF